MKIVSIPKRILVPVIIVMCTVGSFAINNNYYDIIIMLIAGIVGYFMSKGGYPLSPIVLALILGPMAEGNFRRSLVMSQGSYSIFSEDPSRQRLFSLASCRCHGLSYHIYGENGGWHRKDKQMKK